MKGIPPNSRPENFLFAILLAFSLLIAQGLGLHHRISHAQAWLELKVVSHAALHEEEADHQHGDIGHSCLVFDAAALGASLQNGDYPLSFGIHVFRIQPDFAFVSWQAAFLRRFFSRAPPLA